jgi:hypothetical protein
MSGSTAQHNHAHSFDEGARGQHHGANQAQDHEGEVFGWTEFECNLSEWGGKSSQNQGAHTTGKERTQTSRGQGRPSSPFSGHLVTINDRYHRG